MLFIFVENKKQRIMKKIGIVVIAILSTTLIMAQDKEMTVDLGAFTELKVYDRMHVKLVKSDTNKAIISGDDTEDVSLKNKDGLLKVRMELEEKLQGDDTYVTIYYAQKLVLVDANEGAHITAEGEIEGSYISFRAQEGATIDVKTKATRIDAKAVSGGEVTLSGKAENLDVNVRSGGQFYGSDLKTETTEATVFAGGEAEVYATEFIEANVTAGGEITIYGNPKEIKKDTTFGGKIK